MLGLVQVLKFLARSVELFILVTLFRILRFFFWTLGKPIVLILYQWYKRGKTVVEQHYTPSKSRFLYPLSTPTVLYGFLAIVTLAVTANNLFARELREEDIGAKSILGALISSEVSEEVVEEGFNARTVATYRPSTGFLTAQAASAATTDDTAAELSTAMEGSTLVQVPIPTTNLPGIGRTSVTAYVVQGGDTIASIAKEFGLGYKTILWANGLEETSVIKPGMELKIPPVNGVVHMVKKGETLEGIAAKYKAELPDIIEFNQLAAAQDIDADEVLIIPGGEIEEPKEEPLPVKRGSGRSQIASLRDVFSDRAPTGKAGRGGWLWPTDQRKLNQYFRWRHTGIDVEGDYKNGIYASRAGRVVKAQGGWNNGYGNIVILDHGDGTQALYGHASKLFVRAGEYVKQGQTIAMIGTTGRSTGTHLHFEIIVNGRKVNPLGYVR